MKRNYLVEIIAALFILLFVYTATSKLLEYQNFRSVLHGSPLMKDIASYVAWALPVTEIGIALLLFFPKTRRKGLWASLTIMILFTGYIGYMLYFSSVIPCSCGGVLSEMTWDQHFIFNIFFTLLAIFGLWWDRRKAIQSKLSVTYSGTM